MTWEPNVVGGVDAPKVLYHGTDPANVASILAKGLVPSRPQHRDHRPELEPSMGVYLTPHRWLVAGRAVLRVKVQGLELVRVNGYSYVSLTRIKPKRIKIA